MKFRGILLLSLVLMFFYSCSKEYKMKKNFKEAYTSRMKDADSYVLVSFEIFQNGRVFSEESEWYLKSYKYLRGHENDDYQKIYDSLSKVEEQNDPKWIYTGALVKIKGTNSYGGIITRDCIAYYLMDQLIEIDDDKVFMNNYIND